MVISYNDYSKKVLELILCADNINGVRRENDLT